MNTINRAQRIRNFPVEPYATRARYLLYLFFVLACVFALTWAPGMDDHIPTVVSYRWHIASAAVVLFVLSSVLHRYGRRI